MLHQVIEELDWGGNAWSLYSEVSELNLSRNTDSPDLGFCGFRQSLRNSGIVR
jgi:hypothetical protein